MTKVAPAGTAIEERENPLKVELFSFTPPFSIFQGLLPYSPGACMKNPPFYSLPGTFPMVAKIKII
jgi:hypothetical protein